MPTSVTAIIVAADGSETLRQTLAALATQTRAPDRLVVVQLGDNPITARLIDAATPSEHRVVPARTAFGDAVRAGLAGESRPADRNDEWLWLLASDSAPNQDALERLLGAVEVAPSVGVVGPKQMQWDAPAYLNSYGETMTPHGARVELAEPELDQAQYDRVSDVLAVAAGGMLVRGALWDALGGFDPALPVVDDALDFCVRTRLAGQRVELVPSARVRSLPSDDPGSRVLGRFAAEPRRVRYAREAQLHRRLVYAPLLAVPVHWLLILPLGVVRAIGRLLRKQPGCAPAELLAALTVFVTCTPGVHRARRRIRRTRTEGWKSIAPLRMQWRDVRHRRSLLRDNAGSASAHPAPGFFGGGGLSVTVALAALSLVLFWPLIGSSALVGGGLLPLGSLASLWGSVGWGTHPIGSGFTGPADPFVFVLAVLGSLWPTHPSAAIVALWIAAIPIAGIGGWFAAAAVTRRAALRTAGALAWGLAPTLLAALDSGRIGPVLVHLAVPFALLAARRARASWTAAATLGLLGAVITAGAPSLLPFAVVTWAALLLRALMRAPGPEGRGVARVVLAAAPATVLWLPLAAEQLLHGSLLGLLAEPGGVLSTTNAGSVGVLPASVAQVLQFLAGWPAWDSANWTALLAPLHLSGAIAVFVLWGLTLPLLIIGAIGLLWPRRDAPLRFAVLGAAGLVLAVLATRLELTTIGTDPVSVWPGSALSLAWIGLVLAAVSGLDRIAAGGALPFGGAVAVRGASAATIGLSAVIAVALAGSPLLIGVLTGSSAVSGGTGSTVPALVAAEAQTVPGQGLLTLTLQSNGGVRQQLVRGAGRTLEQTSTLATTAGFGDGATLTRLAAALVQPTGEDLSRSLATLGIGFVLLAPGDGSAGSAAARSEAAFALGSDTRLQVVSSTSAGTLYRVKAGVPEGFVPAGPSNTGTPIGVAVLSVQGAVLAIVFLLALPTRRVARRVRPAAPLRAPRADVASTEPHPATPSARTAWAGAQLPSAVVTLTAQDADLALAEVRDVSPAGVR